MLTEVQTVRTGVTLQVGEQVTLLGVTGVVQEVLNRKSVRVQWEEHTTETVERCLRLGYSRSIAKKDGPKVLLRYSPDGYQLYFNGRPVKCWIGFVEETFDAAIIEGMLPEGVYMHDIQIALNQLTTVAVSDRSSAIVRDEMDPSMVRP